MYTHLAKLPLTGDKTVVALPEKEQGEDVNWLDMGHCGGSHQALVRVFSFSGSKKVKEYSLIQVAYGHLAISTFSPIGSWSSNGMRVCVCMDRSMHYVGISTYQFISYYASAIHKHMYTRILKPFEHSELMGLKVDIAGHFHYKDYSSVS